MGSKGHFVNWASLGSQGRPGGEGSQGGPGGIPARPGVLGRDPRGVLGERGSVVVLGVPGRPGVLGRAPRGVLGERGSRVVLEESWGETRDSSRVGTIRIDIKVETSKESYLRFNAGSEDESFRKY